MNLIFNMRRYVRDHLSLYVFVSVLFLMGVVFGAMLVNSLSIEQKLELSRFLGSYMHAMEQGFDGPQLSLAVHVKWIALIGLFGLTVIGIPFVLVLDFLKGVLIGFTVGYMVGEMAWKGLMFALVAIAPQNVMIIPLVIVASVSALSLSIMMVRHRFNRQTMKLPQQFAAYTLKILALITIAFGVSMYEVYVSPVLIRWIVPHTLSLPI